MVVGAIGWSALKIPKSLPVRNSKTVFLLGEVAIATPLIIRSLWEFNQATYAGRGAYDHFLASFSLAFGILIASLLALVVRLMVSKLSA